MSLAKEVNEHLDNILAIRAEIRKMESEIKDNQTLTNKTTGEVMNKREVVSFVEKTIDDIKIELNTIFLNIFNSFGLKSLMFLFGISKAVHFWRMQRMYRQLK